MLHELRINGLPETTDSLAWSEAGDLCVITGVKVHLYIPCRKANHQHASQPALKPWSVVVLEVNNFSLTEWPTIYQQPYAELSIGEEESESHVVSCSWSAPGLAQHDRCMLGILTANGLYSLWDAEGDPTFTTSWKRVLVLNRIVESFFKSENSESSSSVPARRYRIRSAAWTKELKPRGQQDRSSNFFLLALLNDQGEIIFLKMNNTDDREQSKPLSQVIHVLRLDHELDHYPDGLLEELRWLDWQIEDESLAAPLLCSTEGRTWTIRARVEHYQTENIEIICSMSTPESRAATHWNTPKAQTTMLGNQSFCGQQVSLKKGWEAAKGEGYPAFTRYYGVAAYKDFQALHISFHPRTVIEYHIQIQELSFVLFSHSGLEHSIAGIKKFVFDWETPTPTVTLSDTTIGPWTLLFSEVSGSLLKESLEDDLKNTCAIIIRLYIVMAFFRGWNLAETSNLVGKLSDRSIDPETLEIIDEYREESSSREALQQIEGIVDSFFEKSPGIERCSICGECLRWHGEKEASCEQAHHFDRCSLTLLAIQQPGISKFCSSCNREYIDKSFLLGFENVSSSQFGQLLSNLFKAFPKCIYCGGTLRGFT